MMGKLEVGLQQDSSQRGRGGHQSLSMSCVGRTVSFRGLGITKGGIALLAGQLCVLSGFHESLSPTILGMARLPDSWRPVPPCDPTVLTLCVGPLYP